MVPEAEKEEDEELLSPANLKVEAVDTPTAISRNNTSFFTQGTKGRSRMLTEDGDLTEMIEAVIPEEIVTVVRETWGVIKD